MSEKDEDPSNGLFTVECNACKKSFPAEAGGCDCGGIKGTLKLDIDIMLERIYALHLEDEDDRALDVIFNVYWNLASKFDIMNDILGKIDLTKIDSGIMVCFMMQTFKYASQVLNHVPFCNKVAARLKELNYDDEHIHDLVDNYRGAGDYWKNMKMLGAPEWLTGPKPQEDQ